MGSHPLAIGRQDVSPPVVSGLPENHRTPVYFFDINVVAVGNLGGVSHASKPCRRHEHHTVARVSLETEYRLTVPLSLRGPKAHTIKP